MVVMFCTKKTAAETVNRCLSQCLLVALFFWVSNVAFVKNASAKTQPPNVVFILADDLGYGDIKCFGQDLCQIETPGFDRLAAEGMRFTDAHANASVCVPTRVAIMTGQYPWRFPGVERGGPWGFLSPRFSTEQHTLGTMMRGAGYQTAYVGKWHLGTQMQTTDGKTQGLSNVDYTKPLTIGPQQFGFDYSFILPGSLDMYPYAFVRNNMWVGSVKSQKGWSAFNRVGPAADDFEDTKVLDTFSSQAESFIEKSATQSDKSKPFFLYLALTAPHTPTSPSESFQGKSKLGIYGDFVMETDHCVKRVLDALDKHELVENTLVIATSDHGSAPYAGRIARATFDQLKELKKDGHHSTGPFRGYKFSVYEGGLRVPFVARWPNVIEKGTTCNSLIGVNDLMATLADIANVQLQSTQAVDSVSMLPLMKAPSTKGLREDMILQGTRGMVFRTGNNKLATCPGSGSEGRFGNSPKANDAWKDALAKFGRRPMNHDELAQYPFLQLFDLSNDVGEAKNLAAKNPELVQSMMDQLNHQIDQGFTRPGAAKPKNARSIKPFSGVPQFVWQAPQKTSPKITSEQTDGAITMFFGGKPILKYNVAVQKSPAGISSDFERSGYIHPIYTPAGVEVTGDFPPDHAHQHALFNAWTSTTFEGRSVDFWNQAKKKGRVSHQKVIRVGRDEFVVQLLHEDLTSPTGPKPVLEETWAVKVIGLDKDAYVFDITSVQTCVANSPLRMNQYRYGGMGIRGNNQWINDAGTKALSAYQKAFNKGKKLEYPSLDLVGHRFTTSDGKRRFEGNHSRPTWVDLSGKVDGQIVGVSILGNRRNFRFPQPVRLHPTKPYFCFAPMVVGDFEIAPWETYESRFRYIVHDGDLSKEVIQRQWNRFK